jgi:hypothetical protein
MRAEEGKKRVKAAKTAKNNRFYACLCTLPSLPVGAVCGRKKIEYQQPPR